MLYIKSKTKILICPGEKYMYENYCIILYISYAKNSTFKKVS